MPSETKRPDETAHGAAASRRKLHGIRTLKRVKRTPRDKRVLLMLLPFWSPLIPPLGLASLKSSLQAQGFHVKTADANVDSELKSTYNRYFDVLKEAVERSQRGNFYAVGMTVMRNHLMAHLRCPPDRLPELVSELVFKNFYCTIGAADTAELITIVEDFYRKLRRYVLDRLQSERPDVLGISVFSGSLPASMFAFQLAKEKLPQVMTVMGGGVFNDDLAPGSLNLKAFLEAAVDIDYLVVGEGEETFVKLLRGLDLEKRVHISSKLMDLNLLSSPDFTDFELHYYPYMASYTARGCPFVCAFCSEADTYRKRTPAKIVEELSGLHSTYQRRVFLMGDSLLNPVISELAREMVRSGPPVYWDGYLRAHKTGVSESNVELWRRAGFYRARLGVESGSDRVLKLMNKKITTEDIRQSVTRLANRGIKTTTYWVIGYPGETEDDFQQNLRLLEELCENIYEAECSAFTYYELGQINSESWERAGNRQLLYSDWVSETLLVRSWMMDCPPAREEVFDRVWRFTSHCEKLGIPNPYSLHDIYEADARWSSLHREAVPGLVELMETEDAT